MEATDRPLFPLPPLPRKYFLTMNRYSRSSKKKHEDEDDDDEQTPSSPPLSIAEQQLLVLVPLGRPPRTEEEKHEVFVHLIRLKENRRTNKECAETLGISERTVVNYLSDPYYGELVQMLQQDAKQRGHLLISDVIDEAVGKLYGLMHSAKSEFVQYKSAEYLLKMAGYEVPQEQRERDNQADVIEFLSKLGTQGKKPQVQVNVQINNQPSSSQTAQNATENVIEASIDESMTIHPSLLTQGHEHAENEELAQYLRPMLPGGKIPKEDEDA